MSTETPELLNQTQAAAQLGISPTTLRNWSKTDDFPDVSSGYDVAAIAAWRDAQANADQESQEPAAEPVRKKHGEAGPCPRNPQHTATRVYKTDGKTRRCKCNDCGETWKITARYSDNDRDWLDQMATELETAPRENTADGPVLVLDDDLVAEIVAKLRDLAAA